VPHCWPVETGIMVEIPSAAILAKTLAAERGNPALAGLADALHPAVLKLIRKVCKAAESHGKWVGVCGELAGDPAATAVLVGLGVRELSMTASSIPRIKRLLSSLELASAQALAQELLALPDAFSARKRAVEFSRRLEQA
jgi:phosphoenolpyruvate-protein kinase (PTS system EI component)